MEKKRVGVKLTVSQLKRPFIKRTWECQYSTGIKGMSGRLEAKNLERDNGEFLGFKGKFEKSAKNVFQARDVLSRSFAISTWSRGRRKVSIRKNALHKGSCPCWNIDSTGDHHTCAGSELKHDGFEGPGMKS